MLSFSFYKAMDIIFSGVSVPAIIILLVAVLISTFIIIAHTKCIKTLSTA